jgi:UDP-N-acetylmuramoyl-L-alanyl-D-glutamate--2,6-diaminopimelate ligase
MVVLTSDNPRSECPEKILADISQSQCRPVAEIVDRQEAIEFAIKGAEPGDVVVLAGKGHETEQVLNDKVIPFSDYQVAFDALSKRACA